MQDYSAGTIIVGIHFVHSFHSCFLYYSKNFERSEINYPLLLILKPCKNVSYSVAEVKIKIGSVDVALVADTMGRHISPGILKPNCIGQ